MSVNMRDYREAPGVRNFFTGPAHPVQGRGGFRMQVRPQMNVRPGPVHVESVRVPSRPACDTRTTYVVRESEPKAMEGRAQVAVWTAIIGGITALFLGTACREYDDAKQSAKAAREEANRASESLNPEERATKAGIADLKEKIAQRTKDSAAWDISLRTALVAGCAIGFVGALLVSNSVVMLMGVVITVAAIGAMLFKVGNDKAASENAADKARLNSLAETLKA